MAEIHFNLPGSILFGSREIYRLSAEAARYGERVMLITDESHIKSGLVQQLCQILESNGRKVIQYPQVQPSSSSFAVVEALHICRSAKVQQIVGAGSERALTIARATAHLAMGGHPDDLFEGRSFKNPLPLIQIPTSLHAPFLFSDYGFLTESRSRTSSLVSLSQEGPGQIIVDPALVGTLDERSVLSGLLEVLSSSLEASLTGGDNFLTCGAANDALGQTASLLIPLKENPHNQELKKLACEAMIKSSFALSLTTPLSGLILSWVTASYYKVPRTLVSAVVYPWIIEAFNGSEGGRLKETATLLASRLNWPPVTEEQNPSDIIRMASSHLGLPLRLKDLGIAQEELALCSDTASRLLQQTGLSADAEALYAILKEAW